MGNSKPIIATMGIKEARYGTVTANLHIAAVEVELTRRYIWWMKLRYIWAAIRMKFPKNMSEASNEKSRS